MSSERIEDLEKQIADLNRRWPAHSPPLTMLEQLEELEAELEKELERVGEEQRNKGTPGQLAMERSRKHQSPRGGEAICLATRASRRPGWQLPSSGPEPGR